MHEEGRTWEVTSLFRKLKVSHFPPCPLMRRGCLAYSLRSTQKEEARRAADTPGFFALPPWEMRGEMEKRFPQRLH